VKGDEATFGEVAANVLNMALKDASERSTCVHVVFDTYRDISIKSSERSVRGVEAGHSLQSIAPSHIVRQWRKYLSQVNNKTSKDVQKMFTDLGQEWDLSPEVMNRLEAFTCLLYANKAAA